MVVNQKGEGKGGLIFGILVLAIAVYFAWKVVPVMIRVYTFEDRVKEECKFMHGRNLEQLEKDLLKQADLQDLPVKEENVEIQKVRSEDHNDLRVKITYTVPIVTPVKVFNWDQQIDYEAPVFD